MKTIQEIHRLSPVISYDSPYGIGEVSVPNLIFGIELEIEEFDPDLDRDFSGIDFTDDGSLRNSMDGIGIEAITYPIKAKYLEQFLKQFFNYYSIGKYNYSERCSTHVHMDVQGLTHAQLASICLVYQTVESLLFAYVGNDRGNNIFCVPWNQCGLSYTIVGKLASFDDNKTWPLRNWQKYSALNLLPITSQGSIEFRHLEGTCDIVRIMNWINILSQIYKYSISKSFVEIQEKILNMNTISNYQEWMEEVFEDKANILKIPDFERYLFSGVVDSKLAIMKEENKNSLRELFDMYRDRLNINIPEEPEF